MARRFVLLVVLSIMAAATPALAGRRMALVIGNDTYLNLPDSEQLHNAVSDARLIETTLKGLGFTVSEGSNLTRSDFIDKLSDFAADLQHDDVAMFFYAGHGVTLNGQNYVLPTDIPVPHSTARNEEQRLADHAVSEAEIHERITAAGVAVVVLDSCRDNPLSASTGRSIGIARGLARPPETQGVLSIYSAGIGQQALDRLNDTDTNPNSVFTRVFAKNLTLPGRGLRDIAFSTQREVAALAQGAGQTQFPGVYSELTDDVYLNGSSPAAVAPVAAPPVVASPTNGLSPEERLAEAKAFTRDFFEHVDTYNAAHRAQAAQPDTKQAAPQQQASLNSSVPAAPPSQEALFGVQFSGLTPAVRAAFGLQADLQGVAVTGFTSSLKSNSVLKRGDVVKEVSGAQVRTVADLESALSVQKRGGKKAVLFLVSRDKGLIFAPFSLTP